MNLKNVPSFHLLEQVLEGLQSFLLNLVFVHKRFVNVPVKDDALHL
jgi:hypothetical protein